MPAETAGASPVGSVVTTPYPMVQATRWIQGPGEATAEEAATAAAIELRAREKAAAF